MLNYEAVVYCLKFQIFWLHLQRCVLRSSLVNFFLCIWSGSSKKESKGRRKNTSLPMTFTGEVKQVWHFYQCAMSSQSGSFIENNLYYFQIHFVKAIIIACHLIITCVTTVNTYFIWTFSGRWWLSVSLSRWRWQLVGLVAWGIGCAQPGVPGVYVNIPAMIPWIQQSIQPLPFNQHWQSTEEKIQPDEFN